MEHRSALRYYGGKNANANSGTGRWVFERIPWKYSQTYLEAFAGMLGVLLQRKPVSLEVVNDSNSDLIDWWLTVRDHGEAFIEKLRFTPHSRELVRKARAQLKDASVTGMDRTLAYHIVITQDINASGGWSTSLIDRNRAQDSIIDMILFLRDRMKDVQLENKCALELIDQGRTLSNVMMYLDPPYENANVRAYGDNTVDYDALRDLLGHPDNKAMIAISGYGDSYDGLGWQRHEKHTEEFGMVRKSWDEQKGKKSNRTEVLWTNYDATSLIAPLFTNHK